MQKKINSFILPERSNIRETMQCIDKNAAGIALIVNKDKKLVGVVTDGDIRRVLLSGKNLDSPITDVMNTNPLTASKNTSATELLEIMLENTIRQIPIVDEHGRVVDIAVLSELKSIPLSAPDITYKEIKVINKVLSTPFLSIGPKIKKFEEKIANYIGVKHAIGVNSGTSGLHLCIRSLDIKDGDEVITTPFSFIASANCILYERAKPVFVDIDENTLCIDVNKIEEKITEKTKAILPVHIFGYPCEMDKILEIARNYNLAVIEDACEAIGAEFRGKKVGGFGNIGVFAFYPNKQITTGEGGMIVTNDDHLAKLCRSMRNQGRDEDSSWLFHKRLGYNYRMSELNAALGVSQMDRIDEILKKRQHIVELYNKRLSKIEEIKIPCSSSHVKISWFVYVIRLDYRQFSYKERDEIMQELRNNGISCKNYFPPIHLEPFYIEMFGYKKGDFPITEMVSGSTIALPFYNNLSENEVDYICNTLEKIITRKKYI